MRNFHAWQRRTMRRADRQLWGGVVVIVAAVAIAWAFAPLLANAPPLLAASITVLRYACVLPLVLGAALVAAGAGTLWRLHRDPILFYYLRDGR